MKLFYCSVCDRHYKTARARISKYLLVRVTDVTAPGGYIIEPQDIEGEWTEASDLMCVIGPHELIEVDVDKKECPHDWCPSPSVVKQTCRMCGATRIGKVIFDD